MERLSLEDFKAKSSNSNELEQLTGGILGSCHDEEPAEEPSASDWVAGFIKWVLDIWYVNYSINNCKMKSKDCCINYRQSFIFWIV